MTDPTLADLGWSQHFADQTDPRDTHPARIAEIRRDRVYLLAPDGPLTLTTANETGAYAVGDWILHDGTRVTRRLTPLTELARRAAGPGAEAQLIAANVDTLGIVSSCNADFNLARIERYLVLASNAGCLPLVILTKADMCDDPQEYVDRARRLSPLITALALNAKDPDDVARLAPWCGPARTLALVGSSGVGKTTLNNRLTARDDATRGIREDDARGRHTTTSRHLHRSVHGGWLIDTPGMRELQLTDVAAGIEAVFDDIETLAGTCKFRDCAHETEPGCAVRAALDAGDLDPARLQRWRKLSREDRQNSESLAQTRNRQKSLARHIDAAQSQRGKPGRSR
ncbi:MAG: ribosome small subunit-dependent GTPase A [Rhodobacter sp.]|nr:ribosome small subunit-dependent GTPase A [Rhodobacter sp.]